VPALQHILSLFIWRTSIVTARFVAIALRPPQPHTLEPTPKRIPGQPHHGLDLLITSTSARRNNSNI
jgi:hypothetical protein